MPLPKLKRNPRGGALIPTSCIGAAYRHRNKAKGNHQVVLKLIPGRPAQMRFVFIIPPSDD